MNTKVLLASIAGAITTFLTGWVLYGMVLKGFYDGQVLESAKSVMRGDEDMLLWAIFVGGWAMAILLAIVFSRWANISTFKSGAIAGAWMLFLFGISFNMYVYGGMNAWTLTSVLVDPIVGAVQGAITGGVIAWVLGYNNKA